MGLAMVDVGGIAFDISVITDAESSPEQLDAKAAALYQIFAEREREFGFSQDVIVEYPTIDKDGPFLTDPLGYISMRQTEILKNRSVSRIVVLTTYGERLLGPLSEAGYQAIQIDMPAGPDNTFAFARDVDTHEVGACTLYLEAVNEADEKIRPTFVLMMNDDSGRLCGGACGSIHERGRKRFAYLAMMTLLPSLPPRTGTRLANAMFEVLRRRGVSTIHLGTQTAGRFYEKLGFRVTHRLVTGVRTRRSNTGQQISDDLVMMSIDL